MSEPGLGSFQCKTEDGGFGESCGGGWKQREGTHLAFGTRGVDQ